MRHRAQAGCRPRWFRAFRGLLIGTALLGPFPSIVAARQQVPTAAARDSFPHRRHVKVACLVCHLSPSGEKLTFQPPRGCEICHHQVRAREGCNQCHQPSRLSDTLSARLEVSVASRVPHQRSVSFPHRRHAEQPCEACHAASVTMAPVDSAAACTGCHENHHDADRACAICHRTPSVTPAHARPVRAHVGCDACHPASTVRRLTPSRSFCLACHAPAVDHHPDRECVTCHFQLDPEQYRARLLKPRPAG